MRLRRQSFVGCYLEITVFFLMKVSKKRIATKVIGKARKKKNLFFSCNTSALCLVSARLAPPLSLAWTFLYLLFFRLAHWFDLPVPTPFANAIQLILTLKVADSCPARTAAATVRLCPTRLSASVSDGESGQ